MTDVGRETMFGIHPVLELLRAGRRRCHKLWMAGGKAAGSDAVAAAAASQRIPVQQAARNELDRRCHDPHHQGVVAEVDPYTYAALDDVLANGARDPKGPFLVMLDQIQDPHNLGAIARTALGCGVHGIIITRHESVGVTPAVVRASAGATEWLPIVQVTNLHTTIKNLKSRNIWIVGLDAQTTQSIYQYEMTGGHTIVMGTEGVGLRRLVKESCDTLLRIPLAGPVDSYNVSVACAMTLGEAVRQRNLR